MPRINEVEPYNASGSGCHKLGNSAIRASDAYVWSFARPKITPSFVQSLSCKPEAKDAYDAQYDRGTRVYHVEVRQVLANPFTESTHNIPAWAKC